MPPANAYTVRWDLTAPAGGMDVFANLTWSSGGRIVWHEKPSSDDVAGPAPDENRDRLAGQQYALRSYTGEDMGWYQPPFEFTSDPVPVTMYLNASRSIQLQLVFKDHPNNANPCTGDPQVDVDLFLGDKILGYGTSINTISWFYVNPPTRAKPVDPEGVGICYIAMAPEQDVILAGTILKLRVNFVGEARQYQLAFRHDAPNTLRFPLYPAEEVLFRYPETQPTQEETQDAGAGAAQRGALAAMVLVSLPLVVRRRRSVLLAAFLFVAAGVAAGCLSKGASGAGEDGETDALKGDVSHTLIRDDLGINSGVRGSIIGRIHDDLHIPVGGVHVSIIGMPNFTTSDSKGVFKFLNLVPGMYKVRFDKLAYQSFEADVEVKVGFVSRPEITMYPSDLKARDFRQHSHDYWPAGQVSRTLMDVDVTCTAIPGCAWSIPSKPDEFTSVIPGTYDVEITVSWDKENWGFDRLGVALMHNGYNWIYRSNHSVFAPRAPGEVLHVATNWEMADRGHQVTTTWLFTMYAANKDRRSTVDAYERTGQGIKPMHVKVVLHRGSALPLEAAHTDPWGDKDRIEVVKGQPLSYTYCLTPRVPGYTEPYCRFVWPAGKQVPFLSQWLEVTLTLSRARTPHYNVDLLYKSAALKDYNVYAQYAKAPAPKESSDGLTVVWKIPLNEYMTDAVYAKTSAWHFDIEPTRDDYNNYWTDATVDYVNVQTAMTLTVSVTAYKTPMPK